MKHFIKVSCLWKPCTASPYMIFNNLMLVSPHGLPGEMPPNALRDSMLPFSHSYGHEECAQLSLRTWVTVIHGHMTAIDRRKKVIIINESFHVPYDHLILATGQQFQVPIPSLGNIDNSHDVPEEPTFSKRPQNLFLINDAHDADAAIQHAKGMTEEHKVVVYGHNIHACCCIQTLLTLGVPGSCISWVQSSSEECCFEDKEVAETVHSVLLEAYVKVFDGSYSLACWNDEQGIPDIITSVTFTSDSTNSLRLDCQVCSMCQPVRYLPLYTRAQTLFSVHADWHAQVHILHAWKHGSVCTSMHAYSCTHTGLSLPPDVEESAETAQMEADELFGLSAADSPGLAGVKEGATDPGPTLSARLTVRKSGGSFLILLSHQGEVDVRVLEDSNLCSFLEIYVSKRKESTNNAYLVYDGKLVIDAAFHTNDVSIRAAGPLTKFHRHYHVDRLTHAYFNSREVGMETSQ
ncbi:cilia- and flagella-associated protein 61-like [Babylonia areolata]|uniref:cilia- and flagella-associated protein 61-like n=1 Tax=Babylonia areolata TaxID=304850 RepID=UPI003FD4FF29